MKLKSFSIIFLSLILFSVFSCSSTSNKSRNPVSKISISPKKNSYVIGETIQIDVKVNPKNGELSKVELFIDNELVETTKEEDFSYTIDNLSSLGNHQIKVVASKTDDKEGTNYQSFEVLSDIIPEEYTYEVVQTFPHSTEHFTQGFEIHNGSFYESTGEEMHSGIFKFNLNSGSILQSVLLEDQYFGEGITIFNDRIYQLTYKAQQGFIYDLETFEKVDSFTYANEEGWGLTHNNEQIIMSDGTEFLFFLDPNTLEVDHKIPVYDNLSPVTYLNELEYQDGYIFANIWTTNYIVKIDAETGKVVARINMAGLLPSTLNPSQRIDVLNGIAINELNGKMYVTGKLWPTIFEIELVKID